MVKIVRHWRDVIPESVRRRPFVLRAVAITLIVSIGLLQLGTIAIRSRHPSNEPAPVTYMSKNKDPFLNTKPADLKDLCNNLPKPRHPRGLFISHKTVDQPLKVFY